MKMKKYLCAIFALSAGLLGQPPPPAPPGPPPAQPPRELTIVVAAPLGRDPGRASLNYPGMASNFLRAFRDRKWPINLRAEQFGGAGQKEYPLELDVFYEPIQRQLSPAEIRFTAWVTFKDNGVKHDLGIIKYVYLRRPFEENDLVLEETIQGAADLIADKIQPLLFPTASTTSAAQIAGKNQPRLSPPAPPHGG
jgi:hypothetical protein